MQNHAKGDGHLRHATDQTLMKVGRLLGQPGDQPAAEKIRVELRRAGPDVIAEINRRAEPTSAYAARRRSSRPVSEMQQTQDGLG